METSDWTFRNKPYDLRERLFNFACVVTRLVKYLHTRGPVGIRLSAQLLECSNSAAANFEEADDGSSPKDRLAKTLITLAGTERNQGAASSASRDEHPDVLARSRHRGKH